MTAPASLAYSDALRVRMNALYRVLRKGSEGLFRHDERLQWGVPAWVVKAYVRAAFNGTDRVRACAVAHYGEDWVARCGVDPAWPGWRDGRAWAWKLGQLERAAASPAAVAA